ncbi:hypothetical protein SMGD1_2010 [Sulfurimonas gotlandica GD1]|uniref:Uncharacterized protein n=1 Tax=Sulfurimonas gotlandica (strain DSM 19862 / JCM 16533 / GD1) TaxID=929558 RepID=B6BJ18_SULGG|nr:hypothetical protein [Sulfurimonas gotlandica]EDZ63178.1 hypothetical protein CBGD1_797 [Sulfurimonas gotlandica GD1]EHP30533.1 hypothetical protein SMGD1_2010 [Sulfurimonas gotlandica GD1]
MSTKEIGIRTQSIIDGVDKWLIVYVGILIIGSVAYALSPFARHEILRWFYWLTAGIAWLGVYVVAESASIFLTAIIKGVSYAEAEEIDKVNREIKEAKAEQRYAEESAIMAQDAAVREEQSRNNTIGLNTGTSAGFFVSVKQVFRLVFWISKTVFLMMLIPVFIVIYLIHKDFSEIKETIKRNIDLLEEKFLNLKQKFARQKVPANNEE